jgi:hypothetical protein
MYFQIGEDPNNEHELIISAEGDTDFFQKWKKRFIENNGSVPLHTSLPATSTS